VRRVTAATQSRAPLGARVRAAWAGIPAESFVLALAVPPLFLHATYQPHVSVPLASTTVDVTLADLAVAAVVATAIVRGRREGFAPLRSARAVLLAASVFVVLALLALATPAVLGEDYAYATHVVSALKLAWYALLLPAVLVLVRSAAEARPLFAGVVGWSVVVTSVGALQFLGLVSEFEGKRPGQREPSIVGIHDFAALSGAALVLGIAGLLLAGRIYPAPTRRRWIVLAVVTGGLGLVLSGAMTGAVGVWLAAAAMLLLARGRGTVRARQVAAVAAILLVVTVGTSLMRATAIEKFAEFLGLRDRVEDTRVESYAHRTLLGYIGLRIWLSHPVAGVGWQASSEEWAYGPQLDDARRRFPDEPAEAFPSPEHPWGVQTLYLQVLADMGVIGLAALVALFAVAVTAAVRGARGSPVPVVGLGWLLVAAGVWAGIGLVPGLPLDALTWLAVALVAVRG
jgi:O-antigen ligase